MDILKIPVTKATPINQCGTLSTVYPPGKEERRKKDVPRGYVPWYEPYERRK